jgi:hypothetical protein
LRQSYGAFRKSCHNLPQMLAVSKGLPDFRCSTDDFPYSALVAGAATAQHGVMSIQAGTILEATTASGAKVRMRAVDRPTQGRDFPVVWVCTEDEYERALAADHEPDALPWPLNAVVQLEPA